MSETNKRASDIMTARLVLMGLFLAASAIYFPWRLTVFNHEAPIFATLFFSLEVIGFVWALIFFLTVFKLSRPRSIAAPQGLAVDVFIPTYNEPVHIVRRTVIAAQNVDLGAMGSYSTSFDSYWSRFTGTYNFGPVKFGPEVLFMGNDSYDQTRFGAALSDIDLNGFATGRVYAGYASTRGQGDDGMYGGLALGKSF